jgi:RNA polymerase sigma factor (sigma-70 family)
MAATALTAVLRRLVPDDATDGDLLSRYVRERDEAAFAALVRRHGGMVRQVCRRVLRNDADADDAVQAVFLVLVRKAGAIRDPNGLANWLFGVAHNVARKARQTRSRRRAKEATARPRPPAAIASDFAELLHAELAKLPAPARAVIVLCDLEGRSLAAAAQELGCPAGTVASRLARGREALAKRLARYGLIASGALTATLLGGPATAADVAFDSATTVSPSVRTLADEVIRTMFTSPRRAKLALAWAGVMVLTATAWPQGPPPKPDPAPVPTPGQAEAKKPETPKPFAALWALSQARVTWQSDDELAVRVQRPCGRFLKLTDANGKAVHVHDQRFFESKSVVVNIPDVQVFDVAGNEKPATEWKKLFREETPMLYTVKKFCDPTSIRKEYGVLLKDEALILVVPEKVDEKFDLLGQFDPIQSLPQMFPGQPTQPGSPVPPPKK